MRPCCPPGAGCNARGGAQRCALDVLASRSDPDAQRALALWAQANATRRSAGRRFARRAYRRVRDRTLARSALLAASVPDGVDTRSG